MVLSRQSHEEEKRRDGSRKEVPLWNVAAPSWRTNSATTLFTKMVAKPQRHAQTLLDCAILCLDVPDGLSSVASIALFSGGTHFAAKSARHPRTVGQQS